MQRLDGRAVSLDIWARGNYVQRLVYDKATDKLPVIVPFRRVEEMRWAYRRLALLGIPVDFIYTGPVSRPKKVLHLYPGGPKKLIEGGWGYVAALGSTFKKEPHEYFPLIGYSQLMPDEIADWLVEEVPEAFLRGEVFVAPAQLVGISRSQPKAGADALATVAQGMVMRHGTLAQGFMEIELPHLDAMTPEAFRRFLDESPEDLARFRVACRQLVRGVEHDQIDDLLDEIRAEVAAMKQSTRYSTMRRNIGLLGGSLATFAAGLAAGVAASPDLVLPVAASTGAATATGCLTDMLRQRIDSQEKVGANSFSLLWQLGLDDVRRVPVGSRQRAHSAVRLENAPKSLDGQFHWLCPPSTGMKFLVSKAADNEREDFQPETFNLPD
jgi:hypothetical protein